MSRSYFAFVRRDEAHRYHAVLPDFPGCGASVERLEHLADAIRAAVLGRVDSASMPEPTRMDALPRQPDDHEGYWLMVDLER